MGYSLSVEEQLRLADLLEYHILDTAPEAEFDDFTTLACSICDTPIAIITLLDEKRQWFKARIGLEVSETPRDIAFCHHTVASRDFFTVKDALKDPRFSNNPLVLGPPNIRFYAGAPLTTPQGYVIGTLSVIDTKPRDLSEQQVASLRILSRHVVVLLELRKNVSALKNAIAKRNEVEKELKAAQAELEHRVEERNAELKKTNVELRSEIGERKLFEKSLLEAEDRYRRLVELSPDAIFVLKGFACTFANKAGLQLLGAASQEQLAGKSIIELVHPDYREEVTWRIQQLEEEGRHVARLEEKFIQFDGTVIDVEVAAAPFYENGQAARLLVARDITEANRHKAQLEFQANHDDLTQLANRCLLGDRIHLAIASADRNKTMAVVAFIDLDHFKLINDTLGHDVGDKLLIGVAERLKHCVRDGDTVARHGGDEFVLVLQDQHDEDTIASLISRLIEHISQPFTVAEDQLFITCSIGLSVYPRDGSDVHALLKHADAAMYQAKAEGRNQFQFFIQSMNERIRERFVIEARLRRALDREEFLLYYQPQVDLASGKITGTEALIRWQDPELGLISPLRFIPVAEETGLIVPIGQWVLEQACKQNKTLQDGGFAGLTVSVNLSPRQFAPQTLVESVRAALQHSGLDAESLKLEVTESMVMNRPEQAEEILQELKRMGVQLAIDDFGVGYSSLSYLKRFPMDQLKIDQSFVQRVAEDPEDAAITQAVIALGHNLHMKVIAEGVCASNQLAFLHEHGCDEIQGNYFCPAVPFDQLHQMLNRPHPLLY